MEHVERLALGHLSKHRAAPRGRGRAAVNCSRRSPARPPLGPRERERPQPRPSPFACRYKLNAVRRFGAADYRVRPPRSPAPPPPSPACAEPDHRQHGGGPGHRFQGPARCGVQEDHRCVRRSPPRAAARAPRPGRPWSRRPTRPARRAAKPIVHACDMVPSEMSNEATEIITMAVDKYVTNGATRDAPTARPRLLGCALRAGALSSVS